MGSLLAHGIGSREDLPIPFSFALAGAVVALVVSFGALGALWPSSQFRGEAAGRPLPGRVQTLVDSAGFRWALRLLGLALAGFTAWALFFGPDLATNPGLGLVYVLFWVGLVPASLIFGPVWRVLNPLRTLHLLLARATGTRPEQGLATLPPWLGYWPAAAGLLAFVWLELVAPNNGSTVTVRGFLAGYAAVHLVVATVFGSRWFDRGDGFEVYSALMGRLALLGRRGDRRLVLRNPFDGVDGLAAAPGLIATVAVLLGSTAFDGFSGSPFWLRTQQDSALSPATSGTIGLLAVIGLVAGAYWVASWLAGRLGTRSHRGLPTAFAHSLIPIAVGYLIAHYFTLFVFEGQRTVILASDPMNNGANLFGTDGLQVAYSSITPTVIALVQVGAVVTGHVFGVVAAHDRAVRLFPRSQALVGQLPLLVLMVGYTVGGLTLLFAS